MHWRVGREGVFPWKQGRYDRDAGLVDFQESWPISWTTAPDRTVWLSRAGLAGRLVRGKFSPLLGKDGRPLVLETKSIPAKIIPRVNNGAWILEGGVFEEIGHGPNRWRQVSGDGTVSDPQPFPWPELHFDYRSPTLDRAGNLWLCVSQLGLTKLSPDGRRYEVYGNTEGLSGNEVTRVFEDRQENIWVWGPRGGLRRLRKPLFSTIDSRHGMRIDKVYSLAPARNGGVWIGTHNSGAYQWRNDLLSG